MIHWYCSCNYKPPDVSDTSVPYCLIRSCLPLLFVCFFFACNSCLCVAHSILMYKEVPKFYCLVMGRGILQSTAIMSMEEKVKTLGASSLQNQN